MYVHATSYAGSNSLVENDTELIMHNINVWLHYIGSQSNACNNITTGNILFTELVSFSICTAT